MKEARREAETARDSLARAVEQALGKLAATRKEIEAAFEARAKERQRRLVEAAAEELGRKGVPAQLTQQAKAEMERAVHEFLSELAEQLRQQAAATLGAVEQQLRAKTETLIADTHEEIANLIRKPREILQRMLNDALARVVDQLRAEQVLLVRKEQAPLRRQLVYLDAMTQAEGERRGGQPFFSGRKLRGAGLLAGVAIFAMVIVAWAAYFATRPIRQFRAAALR